MPENNAPPWGSNEDFNPEKAWTLIQNLRSENADLKTARETAVNELKAEHAAQLEELQATVQLTDDTAKQYEADLAKERFGRTFDRLAIEREIPLNIASTVSAETEEEAITKLDALAEWRKSQGQTQERRPDPAQAAEPATDEREALAKQIFG